jgi:diacylglycerol O-acyltransferase
MSSRDAQTSRLTPRDMVFLRLEPRMLTTGMWLFAAREDGTRPTFDEIRRLMDGRIDRVPRLRQRVRNVPGSLARAVWEEDPQFHLDRHLEVHAVEDELSLVDLEALLAEVIATPLPRDRPPWRIVVIERVKDNRMALIPAVDHAMGDAQAGVAIGVMALLDVTPEVQDIQLPGPHPPRSAPLSATALVHGALRERADEVRGILRKQSGGNGQVSWTARLNQAAAVLNVLAERRATAARDNALPLRRNQIGSSVRLWEFPLGRLKAMSRDLGVRVYEILLSAVASGVAERSARLGQAGETCQALVPVSFEPSWSARTAQTVNLSASFILPLPIVTSSPLERLRAVSAEFSRKRTQGAAEATFALDNLSSAAGVVDRALRSLGLSSRWDLIVSNFAGPQMPLYMLGAQLEMLYPHGTLGVEPFKLTVTSMLDSVAGVFAYDQEVLPDAPQIIDRFEQELEALAAAASRLRLLHRQPELVALSGEALDRLQGLLQPMTVPAGQTVFAQGDTGGGFYLIHEGAVEVSVDGCVIRTLTSGQSFGEVSLTQDVPRTASVKTLTEVNLYVLPGDLFKKTVLGDRVGRDATREVVRMVMGDLG